LLLVIALTDTFAYIVGRSVGKTKFSDTSPTKTLEGVFGGILIGTFFGYLFAKDFVEYAFLSTLIIATASVFGDLFESYIKRVANMKDSGNILPGHGGVLDRVDGYLFGGVAMSILVRAF
jgi:phosphatidate cytidylyltransferase